MESCYHHSGDDMYNHEIKEKYLDYCSEISDKLSVSTRAIMATSERIEDKLHKDLCQMDKSELKEVLEFADLRTEASAFRTAISNIRRYAEWCSDNGYFAGHNSGAFDITLSDIDMVSVVKNKLFGSAGDFITELSKVCDLMGSGNSVPQLLALGWLGFSMKDALLLKDSQVDLENRIIVSDTGEVLVDNIPDVIFDLLMEYTKCDVIYRDNRTGAYPLKKDKSVNTFIKRFVSSGSTKYGKKITERSMTALIGKINDEYKSLGYPSRITYTNVHRSGMYSRILELEKSGVKITKDLLVSGLDGKNYKAAKPMYDAYKKAFG